MKPLEEPFASIVAGRPAEIDLRGFKLLGARLFTKDLAFRDDERDAFGLRGMLPDRVQTIEEQVQLEWEHVSRKDDALEKYIGLAALQDRNATLFYRLLADHLEELMPVVYTPTVGQACQQFSHIIRRTRGIWITPDDIDRIPALLRNSPYADVRLIVVTDNERILGLGDQGAGGMGIPIGKLALYSAGGGLHPSLTLPVSLDVGTDNRTLLKDPLYMGYRARRLRGTRLPRAHRGLRARRRRGLARLHHPVGGLQGPQRPAHPRALPQPRAQLQRRYPGHRRGDRGRALCRSEATRAAHHRPALRARRSRRRGHRDRPAATPRPASTRASPKRRSTHAWRCSTRRAWCTPVAPTSTSSSRRWRSRAERVHELGLRLDGDDHKRLCEVIKAVKPDVLIGTTGQPGSFDQCVVHEMAEATDEPVIFALSNPSSRVEATPADILAWSDGRALIATGSPFGPVSWKGAPRPIGQANNVFIFPGVGLGAVLAEATRITEEMFLVAARALAAAGR